MKNSEVGEEEMKNEVRGTIIYKDPSSEHTKCRLVLHLMILISNVRFLVYKTLSNHEVCPLNADTATRLVTSYLEKHN